ncbi:MAG: tRNA uridine-5-carboxymethylaminomethyl(34) synthesis GTPase MnmE [Parachlamydiales bacterium]
MNTKDTIAAIATPPGQGGVAIIRISGPDAVAVAGRVFSGPVARYKSHTAHYGTVVDAAGTPVDDALLLPLLGERSYTGEDTVEIQCHGGSLITRRVLETVLAAGARPAGPGEFTFRAFMNGRLDLTQAEAVQELIAAKSERAASSARDHLSGHLSHRIAGFQARLTQIAAIFEAWVDFPEEGLEFASEESLLSDLRILSAEVEHLLTTYHQGQLVREGLSVCLIGAPNVGKSSLMNALMGRERAIVTDLPGTTRDTLEDEMRIGPFPIRLTDTAGIRDSSEVVEREGIRRTHEALARADLILWVVDLTRPFLKEEERLLETLPQEKTVVVWNKGDVGGERRPLPLSHQVTISAKHRVGLDQLTERVEQLILRGSTLSQEEVWITSSRHKQALEEALAALNRAEGGLAEGRSPELLCLDIRAALKAFGRLIGTDITEDILSAIFSKFCVGK